MKNKEYVSFTKMIEYIDKTIKYVNGYDFKQFCDDEKTVDATIFAISQIGELVKSLIQCSYKTFLVSQEGFEPPTPGLEGFYPVYLLVSIKI